MSKEESQHQMNQALTILIAQLLVSQIACSKLVELCPTLIRDMECAGVENRCEKILAARSAKIATAEGEFRIPNTGWAPVSFHEKAERNRLVIGVQP